MKRNLLLQSLQTKLYFVSEKDPNATNKSRVFVEGKGAEGTYPNEQH